jgi:hypothetical protein
MTKLINILKAEYVVPAPGNKCMYMYINNGTTSGKDVVL